MNNGNFDDRYNDNYGDNYSGQDPGQNDRTQYPGQYQQPYQQQPYQQQPYQQQPYQQQSYQQQSYQQQSYQQQFQQQYGQPNRPAQPYRYPQQRQLLKDSGPGSGQAIVGMVLSIISIPASILSGVFIYLGIYAMIIDAVALGLGITGLVMSAVGGSKNMRAGYVRGGASVAGIVCGIVGVSFGAVMLACTGCVSTAYCTAESALKSFKYR